MTLREHLEATFERHWETTNSWGTWCCRCLLPWPCSDYEHAVAALAIMDKTRHAYRCGPGCWDCDLRDEPWRSGDVRVAIIDDPGGSDVA